MRLFRIVASLNFRGGAQITINVTFQNKVSMNATFESCFGAFLNFCGEHGIHVVRRVPRNSPL
jgi:hypothetical protein